MRRRQERSEGSRKSAIWRYARSAHASPNRDLTKCRELARRSGAIFLRTRCLCFEYPPTHTLRSCASCLVASGAVQPIRRACTCPSTRAAACLVAVLCVYPFCYMIYIYVSMGPTRRVTSAGQASRAEKDAATSSRNVLAGLQGCHQPICGLDNSISLRCAAG